jgi:DNA N-6-adenine-methyltransferase (Dam)
MTRTAARHSCDSAEWYTPPEYVEAAREVMGSITLDPASHREANRIVLADRYFTERQNGLRRAWGKRERVFLNPPGGLVPAFWHRLIYASRAGELEAAIWIGYSLEQLQTLQGYDVPNPLAYPICVPARRIPFIESEEKRRLRFEEIDRENRERRRDGRPLRARKDAAQPSHANYITYLGRARARFAKVFGEFGEVRR